MEDAQNMAFGAKGNWAFGLAQIVAIEETQISPDFALDLDFKIL